ncbi:MFS transporter [Solwaraspora sp. WMMD1047]|uniref:MFS transporter n=1 Tax=Solwaraspora sp. WMMD1047 TaxID=3016102 RepID=UPI0024160592|nr:MFS transporter [Solwaraspora sp. WMMD1047]MDG4834802.1 MFS transporter [Solwaraspora sp. WMMD1047]
MNLAQLPVAMRQLLVVLLGHHNTGSFTTSGIASAACSIGLALTAPLSGRLLGRIGDRPVLLAFGLAHLVTLVGLTFAASPFAFVALAAAAGLATPPVLSSGRALLPTLVESSALTRAYAVNAVGQELLYVGGPLLVAASLATAGPGGALLTFAAIGTIALIVNVIVIPRRSHAEHPLRMRQPASGRRAIRTLLGIHLGYMTCMGAMWVLIPAFAANVGHPNQAALLVTVWSAGSLVGGLLLAIRGRRASISRAYLVLLAVLSVSSMTLLLPRTVPQMAVAVVIFGLALAPWLAVADELVARAAPAPHTAQAYGWLQTAGQLGIAAGSFTSGVINDHLGTTTAFLLVSVALTAALGLALLRRHILRAITTTEATPPTRISDNRRVTT